MTKVITGILVAAFVIGLPFGLNQLAQTFTPEIVQEIVGIFGVFWWGYMFCLGGSTYLERLSSKPIIIEDHEMKKRHRIFGNTLAGIIILAGVLILLVGAIWGVLVVFTLVAIAPWKILLPLFVVMMVGGYWMDRRDS